MREIVGFQLGNCGNSLGSDFWNSLSWEHGLDEDGNFRGDSDLQLERINVYYEEGSRGGCYFPRAVGIDLEGCRLERLLSERTGKMFRPDSFIGGKEGGSNNYGRGYFSDGHNLLERIMDVSRRETERCDSPQGFQILHGVGGGTGAGLTGLLLERLKDEFMEKMIMSFSVLPSPKVSDIVVEPYNAVLGLKHLIEDTDLTFCLDNEALLSSCAHGLRMSAPRYSDLNFLISNAISGITTCLRFPGQLNTGLTKLVVNAVPFPRLHFMIPSYVPLLSRRTNEDIPLQIPLRVKEMVRELMHPRCRMVAADTRRGKYLTATSIFRGRMSTREVETSLKLIKDKNSDQFVNWIPDNAKIAICDIPPRGLKRAATFFANNTSIAAVWVRILEQYRAMYRRRAYMHWYLGEGMELSDFEVAEMTLLDLIDEYIPLSSNDFPKDDDDEDIDNGYQTAGKRPFDTGFGANGRGIARTGPRKGARPGGDGDGGRVGGGGEGRVFEVDLEVLPVKSSSKPSPKMSPKTSPKTPQQEIEDAVAEDETAQNAAGPEEETVASFQTEREAEREELPIYRVPSERFERREEVEEEENSRMEEWDNDAFAEPMQQLEEGGGGGRGGGVDEGIEGVEREEADENDYLSQFVSDVRHKKRKSKESLEFDKIMERKRNNDADDDADDDDANNF